MLPLARKRSNSLRNQCLFGSILLLLLISLLCLITMSPQGDLKWTFSDKIQLLETINHNSVKSSLVRRILVKNSNNKINKQILLQEYYIKNQSPLENQDVDIPSAKVKGGHFTLHPVSTPEHFSYFNLSERIRKSSRANTDERVVFLNNVKILRSLRPTLTQIQCEKDTGFFIAIMTTPKEKERRQITRKYWISRLKHGYFIGDFFVKATVLFFFGKPRNSSDAEKLIEENSIHKDMVLVESFDDTYENLTLKVLSAVRYACFYCPSVKYFLKIDDDTVANIPAIVRHYLKPCRLSSKCVNRNIVLGYRYGQAEVARKGRWTVNYRAYPLAKFPSYMFGGFYMLRGSTCQVWNATHYFPILPVEDAFVTGVLTAALDYAQITDRIRFADQYFNNVGVVNARQFRQDFVYSATDLTVNTLQLFWKNYKTITEIQQINSSST